MTDHSDAEKAALKDVWKEAIQLLCYFHVGQAEWRWLRKAENKVPDNRRRSLMTILQKVSQISEGWKFFEMFFF